MNEKRLLFSLDDVFFHFGDVVADIVDQMHVKIVGCLVEYFGESLTSCGKNDNIHRWDKENETKIFVLHRYSECF